MPNGNDGNLSYILKTIFGDMPAQWVRIALLAAGLTLIWVEARDIKRKVAAIEVALPQKVDRSDMAKALRRADARIQRLYGAQGWQYEPLREED